MTCQTTTTVQFVYAEEADVLHAEEIVDEVDVVRAEEMPR
jgi:hypothetical protein